MKDWLEDDPLGGREVWGVPSAAQCFTGDCYAAWCEPEQCLREEAATQSRSHSRRGSAEGVATLQLRDELLMDNSNDH